MALTTNMCSILVVNVTEFIGSESTWISLLLSLRIGFDHGVIIRVAKSNWALYNNNNNNNNSQCGKLPSPLNLKKDDCCQTGFWQAKSRECGKHLIRKRQNRRDADSNHFWRLDCDFCLMSNEYNCWSCCEFGVECMTQLSLVSWHFGKFALLKSSRVFERLFPVKRRLHVGLSSQSQSQFHERNAWRVSISSCYLSVRCTLVCRDSVQNLGLDKHP